jgi:hypothetical protein
MTAASWLMAYAAAVRGGALDHALHRPLDQLAPAGGEGHRLLGLALDAVCYFLEDLHVSGLGPGDHAAGEHLGG